jgi:hypothetical protein
MSTELACALLSVEQPRTAEIIAKQAIWRAFAQAMRDRHADDCYSILDLQEARDRLMAALS